ncbi:LADA_0G11210g1_1 [Lachancea dasiensis]|uniref:F-actin-capping protein subunit alpha n=1 Tax=Lachancea dasiensis TaxID=1072105 RepID=A0A1G4JV29_9SACH|nr:LADA_0G11210g1_1 [Lachancea dasiensis]
MASQFDNIIESIISSTPSGEIQHVYKDLKLIAGQQSEDTILDAIAKFNVSNFIPIDVDGKSVIISPYNKEGSKFFDPESSTMFSVDHLNRKALDIEKCEKFLSDEERRLYVQLENYASKAFPGDLTYAVYSKGGESKEVILTIVSTKYSPGNFWNGHWRSIYHYDLETHDLRGVIEVNIHYFEDGNVSFQCKKEVQESATSDAIVSIKQLDAKLEEEMGASFAQMNDRDFKLLRRRLPVTRSKISWGKGIGTYRLGKDSAENQFK